MSKRDYDHLFKLVLIGDTGVGKSCMLLRFADNTFVEDNVSTIGVDFRFRTVKIDKKTVKLQIWDTAGQERFRTITSAYYRGADGIIMVYDTTNKESFDHMNEWFIEVNRYASETSSKILVANKTDKKEERVISTEAGKALAEKLGVQFIEASALSSSNVDKAFESIAMDLMAQRGLAGKSRSSGERGHQLQTADSEKRSGGCC